MSDRVPNQELETYRDEQTGEEFKCGLWLPDSNPKVSFPVYEENAFPIYNDAEIKRLLTDPNRTKRREFFGPEWIQNQRSHGSCNGYAGGNVLGKTNKIRGIPNAVPLSGSYVYSWINGGRDNGSALDDGMNELMAHGAPPSSLCGWDKIYRNQTSQFDEEAKKNLGIACYAVKTRQGFRSAVAAGFLVVVAVHVAGNFVNFKGNGVMPVFNGPGNHAVHVDDGGYINGQEVYDLNNSWDVTWGQQGRGWASWNSFERPFDVHTFYAIVSTQVAGE